VRLKGYKRLKMRGILGLNYYSIIRHNEVSYTYEAIFFIQLVVPLII
jgi:hypothetical protein